MSELKLIDTFDFDFNGEVILWAKEYDHPTTGKYYNGQWYFTANGADDLYYKGSFGREYSVDVIEPTHWMHLPELPKEKRHE